MSDFFDTTTIITIVIAVFVLLRLRSVLGQRTGNERPPFEPYEIDRRTKSAKPVRDKADDADSGDGKVVPHPAMKDGSAVESGGAAAIDAYAKPGTKLNKGLKEILQYDSGFDPQGFLSGARMAYEMIVSAFADGDRKTLKGLLSREVYDGFAEAISDRESRGEQVRSTFVGIEEAAIKSAGVVNNDAQVTVSFTSQIISATLDKDGNVIDGDTDQVAEVRDIWTFARDVRSGDPNWKLVATESEF
ncbi:Tim44/TimA family putative adaptor protein [Salaquimonas pukyongi]|uniref:Tim44/TimA family putative adaptor protein n=1 Tax=Salaquimonas pukyongi TaxID=2712698 RepID=UPI00096B82A9|nr:Tim44/TimA family putative adaptor protein [Salaquimonas pukyongi]